jgi:hypothetical protein
VVLGGCFYVEDINQRPSFAIDQRERPGGGFEIHRGDLGVTFDAISNDPDGDDVLPRWQAIACADFDVCDTQPFAEATSAFTFTFDVPVNRRQAAEPVTNVRVLLGGSDVLGADALPTQEQPIAVLDAPPLVRVFDVAEYDRVASTPIDIFFEYSDADDGPAGVTLEIDVEPPIGGAFTLETIPAPQPDDPTKLGQIGRRLVPSIPGNYTVKVMAISPGGQTRETEYVVTSGTDEPPCIQQLSPGTPPAGNVLPINEPTLFQVLFVDDALDRFPTVAGDDFLGPTVFEWSLRPDGGARQVLGGATGNSVALDPASFTPGDVVELRVEVFDRTQTAIICSDELATCSVLQNACLQRQTWRVEIR